MSSLAPQDKFNASIRLGSCNPHTKGWTLRQSCHLDQLPSVYFRARHYVESSEEGEGVSFVLHLPENLGVDKDLSADDPVHIRSGLCSAAVGIFAQGN